MHILLVTHYALPHTGGIETIVDGLAKQYCLLGHSVTVITSYSKSKLKRIVSWKHVEINSINILERFGIPYPLFNPVKLFIKLNELIPKADIVHLHGFLYMGSIFAALIARHYKIKVVLTEHVGFVKYKHNVINLLEQVAIQSIGRITLLLSNVVVTYNPRVLKELQSFLKYQRPIKFHHGIDTSQYSPASPEEKVLIRKQYCLPDTTIILFVGRLVERKGLHLLVEAVGSNFELVICGRGTFKPAQPNVHVFGEITASKLIQIYRAADMLVLPSHSEGFPITVQEALACGLPVIVTESPEYREYLDESVAIFTELSAKAISMSIKELASNQQKYTTMSIAARNLALERFDFRYTTEAYLQLYTSIS